MFFVSGLSTGCLEFCVFLPTSHKKRKRGTRFICEIRWHQLENVPAANAKMLFPETEN